MATTMRRVGVCRCCMKVISAARGYHIYQPAGKELCLIDDRGNHVPDSMDKGYAFLQIASNWLCVTGNMGNHAPGRWRALPCLCILQILRCKHVFVQCTMLLMFQGQCRVSCWDLKALLDCFSDFSDCLVPLSWLTFRAFVTTSLASCK